MNVPHKWNFVRLGGLNQVVIRTAEDLLHLEELDQKLWVALACPVNGLELDAKTLALVDHDKDGRIRVRDVLEAIQWAAPRLKDLTYLLSGSDTLPLDAINTETPEGAAIRASAETILAGFGKEDAGEVSLADAVDRVSLFASTKLNGDGIITEATAEDDEEVRKVISDMLATVGGVADRSGKDGIDQARADAFYDACAACVGWLEKGRAPEVLTMGEATAAAAAAVNRVREKVDDYFVRTLLAEFDQRALEALTSSESAYLSSVSKDLSISSEEIAAFPIARVEVGRPLPLLQSVNPAWADALADLYQSAVKPLFGEDAKSITAEQWSELKKKVAPYDAWLASKGGAVVEKLGPDRIAEILRSSTRERVNALIADDLALKPEFTAIHGVEQLIRYCRDFGSLLRNFVNFLDFYSPDQWATFQAGILYLDNRSTELCIRVSAASPLAAMSKAYIAYCDCTRTGEPPMKIAACFTQGDSDYLFVGRNGVFYDRQGRDWDANITAVVDSPISVRQAFFLPYKKFVRMIEEQAAKRAAALEAQSDARLAEAATRTTELSAPPAAAQPPKKLDIGVVAALGVAVSGAITALTLILGYIFGLRWWEYPLVLLGIVTVISGPSMLIAWLKLRQRTLGPILEANGWAINGRVKISVRFGATLTEQAKLPLGAHLTRRDPYAEKRRTWPIVIGVVALLAVAAVAIRWDALRHDGQYFWQDRTPPAEMTAPTEPPPPASVE